MSHTCLHYDVTHLSLTTGVVALHTPSWRVGVPDERIQEGWFVAIKLIYMESSIPINIHEIIVLEVYAAGLSIITMNHIDTSVWHAISILTHATDWRREVQLYTSRRQGQQLEFRAKNPAVMLWYFSMWGLKSLLFDKESVIPSP